MLWRHQVITCRQASCRVFILVCTGTKGVKIDRKHRSCSGKTTLASARSISRHMAPCWRPKCGHPWGYPPKLEKTVWDQAMQNFTPIGESPIHAYRKKGTVNLVSRLYYLRRDKKLQWFYGSRCIQRRDDKLHADATAVSNSRLHVCDPALKFTSASVSAIISHRSSTLYTITTRNIYNTEWLVALCELLALLNNARPIQRQISTCIAGVCVRLDLSPHRSDTRVVTGPTSY